MGKFHIHIDATQMAPEFENFLLNTMGFWDSDFVGHPEGFEHFEPARHLTFKTATTQHYQDVLNEVLIEAKRPDALEGYIEGEVLMFDEDIEQKPFVSDVVLPISLSTHRLPPNSFRETEIHITMNRDKSAPELIDKLMTAGFYCAYLPKDYGIGAIFTAQGNRESVGKIVPAMKQFLNSSGGAVDCSIKEERIAHWWLSRPDIPRPPVIKKIEWKS